MLNTEYDKNVHKGTILFTIALADSKNCKPAVCDQTQPFDF